VPRNAAGSEDGDVRPKRTQTSRAGVSPVANGVYERLPVALQHASVSAFGYAWRWRRRGGGFAAYRGAFAGRASWSYDEWQAWQTAALRSLLATAWQAPHYERAWSAAGISLGDLESFTPDDMAALPVVSKSDVRHDPVSFCVGGQALRRAATFQTSGSTGTPLTLYASNDDLRRSLAHMDARYDEFVGVNYSLPRATFSGRRVEPDPDSLGPYHRYNLAERQVYFSPYHLGPATVATYVEALNRHKPAWLTGYAGAITELAHLALEQGLTCPPLRALITTAEPVPPSLREIGPQFYGCPVTEEYGLVEQVAFALECRHGSMHVSPDAGLVEILDESGARCPAGIVGEIVGTGFLHLTQPLVRYRTGDLGSLATEPCACGRATPILATLEGRVDDVVIGGDGRRVGRLSHVPKGLPGVVAMQFVQRAPGRVEAHVLCEGALEDSVRDEIVRRLADRLGRDTEIEVAQVSSLVRTPKGKVRGIVRVTGEAAEGDPPGA
jgi:phenylacetate-CoA ligase